MAGVVLLADGRYTLKASDTVGKETDDDLFIDATKTVKVGTVASPSAITKTLRIPHLETVPDADFDKWQYLAAYVTPNALDTVVTFLGSVVLPKGVTITAIRARMYRNNSSNDSATCYLKKVTDTPVVTTLATLTHSTTGWQTVSASLSQLVGDEIYQFAVSMLAHLSVDSARFMWFELDYTMPDYSKGY